MSSDGRTPLLLLTLSIAAVGIQALMLSPLLTDIAAGLGTRAKEIGFAASAYGVGGATAALLAAGRSKANSPSTCVVDLDLTGGACAEYLDLRPS